MNLRKVTGEGLYLASLKERPESATVHCNRDELAFFELPVSVKRAWNKKAADINGTPSGRDSAAVTALKETAQFHKPAAPEGETPETPETDAKDLEIASRHKCDSQDDLTECYNEMTVHACSLERRLRAGGRDEGEATAPIHCRYCFKPCEVHGTYFDCHNCRRTWPLGHGWPATFEDAAEVVSRLRGAPAVPEKVREALLAAEPHHQGFHSEVGRKIREALALIAPPTTNPEQKS